jgi:hypothetical protein
MNIVEKLVYLIVFAGFAGFAGFVYVVAHFIIKFW